MDDRELLNALSGERPASPGAPPPDPTQPPRGPNALIPMVILLVAVTLLLMIPVLGFYTFVPVEDDAIELLFGAPPLLMGAE